MAHRSWSGISGYLDSAAYGPAPDLTATALHEWVEDWRTGAARFADWLPPTETARERFAALLGLDADVVATGTGVSQLVGLVAASLPPETRVLAARDDFASLLFPLLAQRDRGVSVRLVPPRALASSTDFETDLVAFSLVRSSTGALADHEAIVSAADAVGAMTLVDAAQACGWYQTDWSRFDIVVCPAFKWLCCPRGAAFMTLGAQARSMVRPHAAGWWSSPNAGSFTAPMELSAGARRFDVSPVWPAWVGAAHALEVIASIGVADIGRHGISLANRLREALGMPPAPTPIVTFTHPTAAAELERAGLRVTSGPSGPRLAFHIFNGEDELERAVAAIDTAAIARAA